MLNKVLIVAVCLVFFCTGINQASLIEKDFLVPGDKKILYDSETNLEWLDLSETYGMSYLDVYFSPFCQTYGFTFGTPDDTPQKVEQLFNHAGIASGSSEANYDPVIELIAMLNMHTAYQFDGVLAQGLIVTNTSSTGVNDARLFYDDDPTKLGYYDFPSGFTHVSYPGWGSFIYRPIPEPCTIILLTIGGFAVLRRRNRVLMSILLFISLPISNISFGDTGIAFTKVAVTGMQRPDGLQFGELDLPSISNGKVAFGDLGSLGFHYSQGIFLYDQGSTNMIAHINDPGTPMPGAPELPYNYGPRRFQTFSRTWPSIDGASVVFQGSYKGYWQSWNYPWTGVYLNNSTGLHQVVDQGTQVPGKSGTFGDYGHNFDSNVSRWIDDGAVVFKTYVKTSIGGIYHSDANGTLRTVIDESFLLPGVNAAVSDWNNVSVSMDEGNIVFDANGGIYKEANSTLDLVIAPGTIVNGEAGMTFDNPCANGSGAAFSGARTGWGGYWGIFASSSDGIQTLIDSKTPLPGFADPVYFLDTHGLCNGYSVEDNNFVVCSLLQDHTRIMYTNINGSLQEVIRSGLLLDGKIVSDLNLSMESLSGNQIAFHTTFTDGSYGIYVATIPEPATVCLFLLGGLAALRKQKS